MHRAPGMTRSWTSCFAAVALSALTGCGETRTVTVPACPPSFVSWSRAFQTDLADGLAALPQTRQARAVRDAVRQLVSLRAELRAGDCRER